MTLGTDGQITTKDLCNQAVVERILADDSVTSIKIFANLQSDNYDGGVISVDDGSTGWRIERNTGDAVFSNVVIRGTITAGAGSDVDWSYISNVTIDNADITSLAFSKITAATNTASLVMGASGYIESSGYDGGVDPVTDPGTTGWRITGGGNASFNNVVIRGDLIGNWDGSTPASLGGGPDTGAATGFYFDESAGAAQVEGSLYIGGGGTDPYIRLFADSGVGVIRFYSRGANETSSAFIRNVVAAGDPSLDVFGPASSSWTGTSKIGMDNNVNIDAPNNLFIAVGGATYVFTIGYSGSTNDTYWSDGQWLMDEGSVSSPSYAFNDGSNDNGIYQPATDQIAVAINSVQELLLGASGFLVPNVYNSTTANAANVYVDSAGRLYRDNSSSARYKSNIQPYTGSILALDPKEYDFESEESFTDDGVKKMRRTGISQHTVGFILEEVAEVLPEAVTYNADGEPDGLNWKVITTTLVAEVKRLTERVNVLEAA